MPRSRLLAAVGVATVALVAPSVPATAHGMHGPHTRLLSDQLAAPFNLEVAKHRIYVADGGLELVGKLGRGGAVTPIATDQPGASGIARSHDGHRLAWTTTVSDPATFENSASGLTIQRRGPDVYADTYAYEQANNPDAVYHYGIENPSQCVADAFEAAQFPYDYMGALDSHAYSVTAYRKSWVVADAGANDLLRIRNDGRIETLAVFPPQPLTITADMAAALGFPDCVAGVTYAFESVPTDVEVGRDGMLYVTTLPGGPESPVLGARGGLWKVNPRNGAVTQVAGGFLGATNLAIGKHGEIYVAELFAGRISVVKHGHVSPYLDLPGVVALETEGNTLYAGTLGSEDPPGPGTVVRITGGSMHSMGRVHR